MLEIFRNLLRSEEETATEADSAADPVRIATTALLTEMVRADFDVRESENEKLREAVQKLLDLSPEETEELLATAKTRSETSVSLYDFTSVLHRELDNEQKVEVVELLWSIAFADGELDSKEEFLVRKVARLLHIPHQDFIGAKQRARGAYLAG